MHCTLLATVHVSLQCMLLGCQACKHPCHSNAFTVMPLFELLMRCITRIHFYSGSSTCIHVGSLRNHHAYSNSKLAPATIYGSLLQLPFYPELEYEGIMVCKQGCMCRWGKFSPKRSMNNSLCVQQVSAGILVRRIRSSAYTFESIDIPGCLLHINRMQ